MNCQGLCSCADVDSITCKSSTYALQCAGTRSCQESGSASAKRLVRGLGYMAFAGSDLIKSTSDYIICWGEVKFLYMFCKIFNFDFITYN